MLVLPPITVGYSGHYDTFPFTLTFDYETMIHVIYDIVESVLRNGINKIFLMNGHDGNIAPIEIAARKIKEKYPDARIASLPEWWVIAGKLVPEGTFEVWNGLGHAGEGELRSHITCSHSGVSLIRRMCCAGSSAGASGYQMGFFRDHGYCSDW